MGKKKRDEDEFHDQLRVYRGVLPWSVAEHDWVIKTFNERWPKGIEGLPIPNEYPEIKDELKMLEGAELERVKDLVLFIDIFRRRYPKKIEYQAHSYRFNQINKFLDTYYDELAQMRFLIEREDGPIIVPQLVETLCTSLFDAEDFDESGEFTGNTFEFKGVVAETEAKIKARNKKTGKGPLNEDSAFRGLVPWSMAEFNWLVEQHMARRNNPEQNQELVDEYLPLKLQILRQGAKGIDNFETMALLNEIFHDRYPNRVEAMAHFFRYRAIYKFLEGYKKELVKEGLVDEAGGDVSIEPELIDSLCVLPYSLEQTEKDGKSFTFLYSEVVARARAKKSARLN